MVQDQNLGISANILDTTGLRCPLPMLKAKKTLATMSSGEILLVLATDANAPSDFVAFCKHTGHVILSSQTREDGVFELVLKRK